MAKYSPVVNPHRLRFAPRPAATLAAIGAVILFGSLGNWQLGRAEEKRALAADFARQDPARDIRSVAADGPRYRRVFARGSYDASRQILLDNRVHAGRAGVHVLTPMVLADGSTVLVNRGWQPFGATRAELPEVAVSEEARRVHGRLDQLPRPAIELVGIAATGWPRLMQYPTAAKLAAALGRELRPGMILLEPGEPDGYVREWTVPGTTADRNLGYAVQWFAFAALALAIWLALSLRRERESP
jgi:surfeit locus 1 family protein